MRYWKTLGKSVNDEEIMASLQNTEGAARAVLETLTGRCDNFIEWFAAISCAANAMLDHIGNDEAREHLRSKLIQSLTLKQTTGTLQ